MKLYAQFLEIDLAGKLSEACGSDGVLVLDGRKSANSLTVDIEMQWHKLSKLHKYVGYRIYRGGRFSDNNTLVKQYVISGTNCRRDEGEPL